MRAVDPFLRARDQLLELRTEYDRAVREFRWPRLDRFNWARDYFDAYAAGNDRIALWIVDDREHDTRLSFAELSERSNRVAAFLHQRGARRGQRLLLMLPNVVPLWETMLACMKLGVVIVPSTTLLSAEDLRDRFERGAISPFELESVLVEHPHVAEAAVVPSPDPVRGSVPKAYVVPRGLEPSRDLALDIFRSVRSRLSAFKRVRRLEFAELPKTVSGKIRRVELRAREVRRGDQPARGTHEYWEDDFPELRGP